MPNTVPPTKENQRECNIGVVWPSSDAILAPRGPRRNAKVSSFNTAFHHF
jgi:hypothetical protein